MPDFHIRSESVDVEQIMKQIRTRISEKRGVDYTEEQIRELASVRLEKFLDAKNLRSDLLEQFRRSRPAIPAEPPPVEAPYEFSDETLFASHRGALRLIRKLLKPVLKLFFNPNTLNQILHTQAQFNVDLLKREQRRRIEFDRSRADWNALYYEVLHNLVLETTRNGIELKNLKMRLEALASRLDFSERRVRALEGVVQYRPEVVRPRDRERERRREPPARQEETIGGEASAETSATVGESTAAMAPATQAGQTAVGESGARRRRRRRRGRRGTGFGPALAPGSHEPGDQTTSGENSGLDEEAFDGGDELEAANGSVESAGATADDHLTPGEGSTAESADRTTERREPPPDSDEQ
jgi:hypothetical protein